MSLTKFISDHEVREKFAFTFSKPSLGPAPKLVCPPKTTRYSLVGTAYDYLLRFVIEARETKSVRTKWVAESAVDKIKGTSDFKRCNSVLQEATSAYATYLKTKKLDDKIIRASVLLAQLDLIFRSSVVDPNLGQVSRYDMLDLRALIISTNLDKFKPKKICLLNPTFGNGSALVGGADADMIIDNTIIDLKTTKKFKLDRKYYNQLIGYYVLSQIGGVKGIRGIPKIKNIAIYYSRFAKLVNFRIADVTRGVDMGAFIEWFQKKALATGTAAFTLKIRDIES